MFSVMELRLIRTSVKKIMADMLKRKASLDPESDDAIEIANDLVMYQHVLEKINERQDV
ncbi:MAG: hypothetical protein KKE30_17540 [Gammaproteobacteria bacterium]|nr:hypothetical protein [Gammaproteobacteria bacterium]MBU1554869.1 hypothetical protein [Gammaproteobacteria bacterium]MBU2071877.1 hypothetical protein [Gammaproteobacteria bacterium]MBU2181738.1 hypothetical protein [Gammaproteobacteria bacterium]MBU2206326.1 hypothetical protein [Gammaproteobacteria bacterium]